LDGIDTTATWKVEIEKPVMESTPDWLQDEAQEEVIVERVVEEEDALEQTPLQEVTIDTWSVPPLK